MIEPKVYPEFKVIPYRDKVLLRIDVREGFNRPYLYKEACYARKGSVTRRLSRNGILELLSQKVAFDSIPFGGSYEISKELIKEFIKRIRERRRMRIELTSIEVVLRKLNLIHGSRVRNGVLMLFHWNVHHTFHKH